MIAPPRFLAGVAPASDYHTAADARRDLLHHPGLRRPDRRHRDADLRRLARGLCPPRTAARARRVAARARHARRLRPARPPRRARGRHARPRGRAGRGQGRLGEGLRGPAAAAGRRVRCCARPATLGLGRAVASSSSCGWVDGWLRRHGIRELLDVVVARDDVRKVKPDPELFLLAAARLGSAPRPASSSRTLRTACARRSRPGCAASPCRTRSRARSSARRSTSCSARWPSGRSRRSSAELERVARALETVAPDSPGRAGRPQAGRPFAITCSIASAKRSTSSVVV